MYALILQMVGIISQELQVLVVLKLSGTVLPSHLHMWFNPHYQIVFLPEGDADLTMAGIAMMRRWMDLVQLTPAPLPERIAKLLNELDNKKVGGKKPMKDKKKFND